MNDLISRQAALEIIQSMYPGMPRVPWRRRDWAKQYEPYIRVEKEIKLLPSAQPEWNNHIGACVLADLFDDTCACNYNGIDEWLPGKCELLDSCPNPVGVACWEQYLKHRDERRTDEGTD